MLHASSRPVTFQSTRPVRGETGDPAESVVEILISIHSPRAGRDSPAEARRSGWANFNPLAPCGARQLVHAYSAIAIEFQSTRPVRGETTSAHLPHATSIYFNPLAPCGARRKAQRKATAFLIFQSTRPVRGETAKAYKIHEIVLYVFHKIIGTSARIKESTDAYALKVPAFTVRSQPDFLHRFHIAPHLILSTHLQRHKTALLRCVESFQNNDSPDCRSGVNLARGLSAFLACV